MNALLLRALAALIAAVTFVGAGAYTLAHPKNANAPLQPPAQDDLAVRETSTPAPSGKPTASARATQRGATAPPRITLQPGVRATELPGVTYTHVS